MRATFCSPTSPALPKYIADKAVQIVHKTGTGGMLPNGKVMGINDIACVILSNGKHFELAVFAKNAHCTPTDCEELITKIAKVCLDNLSLW